MLFSFDVDCGELIPGHRFIARGLSDCGVIDCDDDFAAPALSLEYELVPGVPPLDEQRRVFDYLVGIDYSADGVLPWEPNDSGAIAPFDGGLSTHGSRGDWPLPTSGHVLRFRLSGRPDRRATPGGELVVDLEA